MSPAGKDAGFGSRVRRTLVAEVSNEVLQALSKFSYFGA